MRQDASYQISPDLLMASNTLSGAFVPFALHFVSAVDMQSNFTISKEFLACRQLSE